MAGVALQLASAQLPKLFGVKGGHGNFWERMDVFFRHVGETNASSLMLGCAALGVLLLGRKLLPNKPVALLVVIGKTGRRMIIPLSEGLRAHIASLPSSDRADAVIHPRALAILETHGNASTLRRKFGELLALAGLRAFATHQSTGKTRSSRRNLNALSFHSLRRTATTLLHEAGIAGAVAQALMGHDSEAIHEHYVNVGRDALQKAVAEFPSI